ncbi:hypothetical protein AGMMS49965_00930 [Bacteroidia bacterium]|nr:hypothetical protein AGMMS49965_00930 [Bacteroidia bacterium]
MEQVLVAQSPLNSVQIHLLKMFAFNKQEENLSELKSMLLKFYRAKVDEEAAKVWDDKNLSDEKIEAMLYSHKRTPYE